MTRPSRGGFVSRAGVADLFVVFTRVNGGPGAKEISVKNSYLKNRTA